MFGSQKDLDIIMNEIYIKKTFLEGDQATTTDEQKRVVTCGVCFDDVEIEEMITLDCDHRFCKGCLDGYLCSKILEN